MTLPRTWVGWLIVVVVAVIVLWLIFSVVFIWGVTATGGDVSG